MEQLRILRKNKGLSMKELGSRLGLAESTISLYETNKREPDLDGLSKIADFFSVPEAFLLGRKPFEYWENLVNYKEFVLESLGKLEPNICKKFTKPNEKEDCSIFLYAKSSISIYLKMIQMLFENVVIFVKDNEMKIHFQYVELGNQLRSESHQPAEPSSMFTPKHPPYSDPTVEKYRALDKHGKEIASAVIGIEYKRVQKEIEDKKVSLNAQQDTLDDKITVRRIPVESSLASAGGGYDLSENQESRKYIFIENTLENSRADYAAYVTGESMEPRIYNGDLLLIREQPAVNIGEIGLFCIRGIHDHGVVKEYASDRLISLNPEYDDIYFEDLGETEEVVCVGKVVNVIHDFDPNKYR